jgi:4'-phosphopantetheinyl transferase
VRSALRELLAHALGIEPTDVPIVAGEHGRPELAPGHMQTHARAIDFNASHSGAHGLIALTTARRVGVDIEARAPGFDWRSIADIALSGQERAHLETIASDAQTAAFYDLWVTKEAVLKAHGAGVAEGLRHFSALAPERGVELGTGRFRATMLAAPPGYAASLAWSEGPPGI